MASTTNKTTLKYLAIRICALVLALVMLAALCGCGSEAAVSGSDTAGDETGFLVAVLGSESTGDAPSLSQSVYSSLSRATEGIGKCRAEFFAQDAAEVDYSSAINILYANGYRLIFCVGDRFANALHKAQNQYPDCNFAAVDCIPCSEDGVINIAANTAVLDFPGEEAAFLAGVAAAAELKSGEVGFIGGTQCSSRTDALDGFTNGIEYANRRLGTTVRLEENSTIWLASDYDSAGAAQLSALMYDRGVKAIYCLCGQSEQAIIDEAKVRSGADMTAWVIGTGCDYLDACYYYGASSCNLISVPYDCDTICSNIVQQSMQGSFSGGIVIGAGIAQGGISLSDEMPNISGDAKIAAEDAFAAILGGEIAVIE